MVATAANLKVVLSGDDRGASQAIARTEKGLRGLIGGVGKFAGGFLLANVIGKVAGGIGDLAGAALDFESNMANVDSIAQLSSKQLETLKASVLGIAVDPRIRQGPAELAAGLYDVESSGFAGDAALTVLSTSAMAATAGITTAATAARVIAGNLNAFGLEADQAGHVSDVLFQTVQDGVLTFDQLANNMANTSALADSLGLHIEDLGAAYALMTLKNVPAAQAETQIASLMRSALNPTAALTDAVVAHGYASVQDALATDGLTGLLDVLDDTAKGNVETLGDLTGNAEAANAALILGADGAKGYRKELGRMNKASKDGGATQKALERQMQSTSYAIGQLKKNVQIGAVVAFDLLGAPIRGAIGGLNAFVGGLTDVLLYVDDVVRGADRLGAALNLVPEPLQRTARGLALVVDGIGDTIRAFREGDLQGAIDELGRIQGDRILGGLRVLGEEAWGAFSDAFVGFAKGGLQLGAIAIDVAGWAIGKIPDLWGWFKSAVYGAVTGGGGGGVAGAMASGAFGSGIAAAFGIAPPLSVGTVLVEVAGWALGKVADLWGWFKAAILNAVSGGGGGGGGLAGAFASGAFGSGIAGAFGIAPPLSIGTVLVNVAGWALGEVADLWGWLKGQLGVGGGGTVGAPILGTVASVPGVDLTDVLVNVLGWAAGTIADVGTWLQGEIDKKTDTAANLTSWTLKVGTPETVDFGVDLGAKIGIDLDAKEINATLSKWTLLLGPPTATEGGGEGGGDAASFIKNYLETEEFQQGLSIGPISISDLKLAQPALVTGVELATTAIEDALSVYQAGAAIALDTWNLNLGRPTIQNLGIAIGIWVGEKVRENVPDIHLPSWNLSLPTPDFPDFDNLTVVNWVETKMDEVGDIATILGEGFFKLKLPDPDFPDLSAATVIGWVEAKIAELGDITVPITVKFDIIPDVVTDIGSGAKGFFDWLLGTQVAVAAEGDGTAEAQSFSVSLSADKSEFDRILGEADTAGLDFENGPPYTGRIGGDRSLWDTVLWDAITGGVGFTGTTFTATLNGDRTPWDAVLWAAITGGVGFAGTTFSATLSAIDNASGVIQGVINLLNSVPESKTTTITTNVNTNYTTTGDPPSGRPRQHGGYVREPLTLVGEGGPELVSLPYGSYVHTAHESRSMIGGAGRRLAARSPGGNTYVVNVNAPVYGVDNLKASIAEAITQADVEASRQYHRGHAA